MNKLTTLLLTLTVLTCSFNLSAQELKVENASSINIQQLPEYVIVTSENTNFLGGIDINIDSKNSAYENQLKELESLLQNRKKLRIRNQTDLLNAMLKLGFEYVDSYSSGSTDETSKIDEFGRTKARVNQVFRKKEEFRN